MYKKGNILKEKIYKRKCIKEGNVYKRKCMEKEIYKKENV